MHPLVRLPPTPARVALLALALLAAPSAAAAGVEAAPSAAAAGFEGWAPLGAYERIALREGSSFRAIFPTRDGEVAVAFHPRAVHARSYHAERVDAHGVRRGMRRPEVTTWSGRLETAPERRDFAKLALVPGGRVSGLLRVGGVLYDLAADLARGDFLLAVREITPEELAAVLRGCGLESATAALGSGGGSGAPFAASATAALREIELGTEADAPFVAQSGGEALANARILAIVNAVNGIYESDLALSNRVVVQRAWTGSDPYGSGDSAALLDAFRSHFEAFVGTPTDDAQLFSGRDFESSVIGRAWVASACGSHRYGVNQGLGLSDAALRVLVAHEEGHNLGAEHSSSGVMAPILDPDATGFSAESRSQIAAYTDGLACLEPIASGAPPLLEPVGAQSVREGEQLDLTLEASDPDDDPLVFGATPLLPGAQMSPDGRFLYAPPWDTAGCGGSRTLPVELFVRDPNGNRTSEVVPIEVQDAPTGATPWLQDPPDRSVEAGQLVSIQLSASDADGDDLAFSSPALPPGASLSDSGAFSWRPTNDHAGSHVVVFTVTDCTGRSASRSVAIEVRAVAPPHLGSLSPAQGLAGARVEIAGTNLAGGIVEVHFGAKPASVYSVTEARLVVFAPAQKGKKITEVAVRVVRDGIASDNALAFRYSSAKGPGGGHGSRRAR